MALELKKMQAGILHEDTSAYEEVAARGVEKKNTLNLKSSWINIWEWDENFTTPLSSNRVASYSYSNSLLKARGTSHSKF